MERLERITTEDRKDVRGKWEKGETLISIRDENSPKSTFREYIIVSYMGPSYSEQCWGSAKAIEDSRIRSRTKQNEERKKEGLPLLDIPKRTYHLKKDESVKTSVNHFFKGRVLLSNSVDNQHVNTTEKLDGKDFISEHFRLKDFKRIKNEKQYITTKNDD
jgi:hypothetical protein